MEPASTPAPVSTPADAPAGDPAPGTDTTTGDPAEPVTEAPVADPGAEPAAPAEPAAAAPPTKPRVDLTARLAKLSREKRESDLAAKAAARERDEAKANLQKFDSRLAKAKAGDPAEVRALLQEAGIEFRTIVDAYAEQPDPESLPPEAKQAAAVEAVRKELDALKKQREDEAKDAAARAAKAAEAQMVAGVTETITKQAEKFEICARLGDEAARDVLKEVTTAWQKAGQPELMPGEFEEAVQAAIEVCEMRYEERGKKLVKQAKAPGAVPASTDSKLPPALQGAVALSDKDADIVAGLIDKSAPLASSQRAKPKTIGSSLGGSAPPRDLSRGDMDPRDALRAVLGQ